MSKSRVGEWGCCMVWRFLLWGMGRVIDIGSGIGLGSDSGAFLEFTRESGFLGLRRHGLENNTSPFAKWYSISYVTFLLQDISSMIVISIISLVTVSS
jgi:hypothetical protein